MRRDLAAAMKPQKIQPKFKRTPSKVAVSALPKSTRSTL
jgi:hypothetical protein